MTEYAVIDPATGKRVAEYPAITDEALDAAVASAHQAHRTWARTVGIADRAALISRVAGLHRDREQELAAIIVEEMGKPLEQALGEVGFAADIYQYYADNGAGFLADETIDLLAGTGTAIIRRQSLGPLLGIMPWNFPYYQVARFAGPNLIVGNTILLKHAPQCPKSAAAIAEIFADAGAPAGAYVNILATNDQIATVIADPRVQGVSLTGSERAGAAVAEIAGRNLKKVVLELGGSDPFILLSTDDLDAVVTDAVAARMDNNGQSCNAAKRFVVADDLYDGFVEKLTAAMLAISPVDPNSDDAQLGPLSSLAAAERLQSQVDRTVASGATLASRADRDAAYFPPAVLTGIDAANPGYLEEFFGPVASVYRVSSEEEAIEIANASPFGLGSYVYTVDPDQAVRIADRIDAGMVFVNGVLADGVELPFGGIKRSGFGREMGRYGMEEFVNKKLIRTVR